MSETVTIESNTGGMQKLAGLMSSEREQLMELKYQFANQEGQMSVLKERLSKLQKEVEEKGRTNWPVVISIMLLLPMISGFLVYVITSQINQAVAPLNQTVTLNESELKRETDELAKVSAQSIASSVADQASLNDRLQLNERMRAAEAVSASDIAQRRGELAEISARLLETEQQFHSVSNIENLRWAEEIRVFALVWEKTFPGTHFPTDNFFPSSIFQTAPPELGK
jgi:hypothetical protein